MSERVRSEVLQLKPDICGNVYGESPCKAGRRFGPTLDFDFIGDAPSLTPVIGSATLAVTRAGATATRVNSAGLIEAVAADTARFDFDPVTLECKGLLVEEARTNLCLQSENLATTWSNVRSSEAVNVVVAPSGATTADKLVEDATASNTHFIFQAFTGTAVSHTMSVFAKAGERSWIRLAAFDGTSAAGAYFNLSTGAIGTVDGGITATVSAYSNGWFRCAITRTLAASAACEIEIFLATGNGGQSYSGDGTSGAYVWGAQIEAGAFATSYILTTSAAVTRNADSALISSVGGFFNATEGSVFVECSIPGVVTRPARTYLWDFDDSGNDRLSLRGPDSGSNFPTCAIGTGSGVIGLNSATAIVADTVTRVAVGYGTTQALAQQGVLEATSSTASAVNPAPTAFGIGCSSLSSSQLGGHIRRLTYYNTRLANANLVTLSGSGLIDRPNACVNTFPSCQDEANFVRTTKTDRFTGIGAPLDKANPARPYILDVQRAPTEIEPEGGLARRSETSLTLVDEPCSDVGLDPYVRDRATAAQGTYWRRWLARNPNYSGRAAILSQAYVNAGVFGAPAEERYIIDRIRNQEKGGSVSLTLRDPTKMLEKAKIPVATDGKLQAEIKAIADTGIARGGANTSIDLAATASAVDDTYNGMEVLITANTGAGQRRVITDYVGETRRCTVAAWAVNPDANSQYEVSGLKLLIGADRIAQYPDPAVTLKRELVRIGAEIIEYTARTADALTFPDSSHRARFGSTREDHALDDNVQLCRAWFSELLTDVVTDLFLEGGYQAGDIDSAGFAVQEGYWYGDGWRITACLSGPEGPTFLLEDLLPQAEAVSWWDPIAQKQKFKALLPELGTPAVYDDVRNFTSVKIETLDDLRVTSVAINFGLRDATENEEEPRNFGDAEGALDLDAAGNNEYGPAGPRPLVLYSRWFSQANAAAMRATAIRKLAARRDAPKKITARLDPKDAAIAIVTPVDIETDGITDFFGAVKRVRCLVTRLLNNGRDLEVIARTTAFKPRAGFIAPNDTADYPADSTYCHICENTGLYSDGTEGHSII
jgi:hypothetical protein